MFCNLRQGDCCLSFYYRTQSNHFGCLSGTIGLKTAVTTPFPAIDAVLATRGRVDRDSQRNAVSGGDGHDLRPFAPLGFAHCEAPFLAAAKLPSIKPSSGSSFPSWRNFSASTRNAFSNWPLRTHCWKRPCTVWYGGYFLGSSRHCAPVRRIHSTPFNTARVSAGGRPRPSDRCGKRSSGSNTAQSVSDTSPRACIGRCADSPELSPLCRGLPENSSQKQLQLFIGQVLATFRRKSDGWEPRQQVPP
jgi:hypothetical protein